MAGLDPAIHAPGLAWPPRHCLRMAGPGFEARQSKQVRILTQSSQKKLKPQSSQSLFYEYQLAEPNAL